jgi:SAM-dependent methyltransferase
VTSLEDPQRAGELKALIARKPALRNWYCAIYSRWAAALRDVPADGVVAEIGSGGGGFSRDFIPDLVATDTLPYEGLDAVVDAGSLPWSSGSVRALFLLNVLHHLPDAPRFLSEAQRVLKSGGLLLITDQHVGYFSRFVLRWHDEPYDPKAQSWKASAEHALSGSNGALAWIIFHRDRSQFDRQFPGLRLIAYEPFSPLQYWLSGGLKSWSLLSAPLLGLLQGFESALLSLSPQFGSFTHIVLRRQ